MGAITASYARRAWRTLVLLALTLAVAASTASLAQTGRLLQLSTRDQVLTGDDVMIGGFVIGGGANKTVAIVATGPSLAAYGIANPLSDPILTLVRSSDHAVIATNDNWQTAANSAQLVAAGLQPAHPQEAAILINLSPGAYTAIVEGAGGGTGVAVIAVYEVDHPEAPLINIATRARVLTGENVMIAGFSVGPTDPNPVVVTVAGPSLAGLVANPLLNPNLALVRMSDRTVIATNDDWQVQTNPSDVAALQANGLQPADPREPAIIATLAPGLYTAIATGVGNTTGVAVVSVYQAIRSVAITSANNAAFTVGTAGTFTITTSATPTATSITTTPLPAGLTLSATSGAGTATISGTPTGPGGTFTITITASNGGVTPNGTQSFTLTVNQAPAITSVNAATFQAGNAGSHIVTATGFPAPTLSVSGALPAGVTFNPATGALAGTPNTGTAGAYPLVFTAANGVGTNATQNFTLTVNEGVQITSANAATFVVGTLATFTITTSATPTANNISITGALPTGVTLGATVGGTAALSGTPAAGTSGTYTLTITASNGGVTPNGTQTFTLTVDQAPAITSANNATFQLGSPNTFSVVSTGFPAPTLTMTGTPPTGVTFNASTGVLSGTPTAAGPFPLTFTAANGVGANAIQSFTLTVNQTVSITSANATTFQVGSAGTFTITTSATPTANLITITGALPAGVTLGATSGTGTAVLSGTPAAATGGSYPITITASNGGVTPNGTQSFTLTVNQAPAITSVNNATFNVGTAGSFAVTSTGFPAPTYSVTGVLPSGVTLNPTTGALAGTPAAGTGGSYPITITASNGVAPVATQSFTLTVNQAPTITSANNATFAVGTLGTFSVTASGFPAAMTFTTVSALPAGVTLSSAGVLSGTPGAGTGGTYPITINATNGIAPAGTQSFTLTVNQAPAIITANSVTFNVGTPGTFTVTTTGFPGGGGIAIAETGALPGGVTFIDNGDGTATLGGTPAAGTAPASPYPLTITANNGVPPLATQSFTLNVTDAAIANDDFYSVVHDSGVQVMAPNLLTNDTGTPGPTVTSVTGATTCTVFPCSINTTNGGAIVVQSNGNFTYAPAASFAGTDSFTYIATNVAGSDPATATITVTNVLPIVDLNGPAAGIDFAASWTEGGGAVAIVDPAQLTVTDLDDTQLTGATIVITNLLDGLSESLSVTCTGVSPVCEGAIPVAAVTYTAATGTLEILATAPLADYEKLLSTLKYDNASANPTATPRDVTVTINDGSSDNLPVAHSIVAISGVNNAPTVTAPATASTAINTPRVFAGTVSVADADAGTADVQVTLTATNGTVSLSTTAGFTSVTGNGTASVVATGPLASQNAALNGMSFNPTPAYTGPATLTINANDLGNTGSGGPLSAVPRTINITVDTPPSVTTTVPANGAAAVVSTSTVTVNFSENVTVSGASFTMSCSVSGARAFNAPVGSGSATIVLTPTLALPGGETCTVTVVAAQVTDSGAQNMTADYVFSFAVNTRPTVSSTVPANGATAVAPSTAITINFSESVNVTGSAFTLFCGGAIPFTVSPASPAASYTLTPNAPPLPPGTLCNVNVIAAQVTDVDGGQTMVANNPFSFTTGAPPAITSANNSTFTVGTAKTFTVTTTGTPTVTNISMAAVTPGPGGTLPSGVAFNYTSGANATVSGTANNAAHVGTYVVSFTATNGVPPDAVQNPFTLTVVCPTITLGPAPGPLTGTFNSIYTQAFTPSGGTAPYSYVVVGSLPNVAFSGNNLTGTPNNTGGFPFTVKAVDTFGCASAVQSYTLNVRPFVQFDSYTALGNVKVDSSAGPGTPFSVTDNDAFPAGTTITGFDTTSAHSGTVTMTTSGPNMGQFTYDPPVGYTGPDNFTYTLTSNGQSVIGNVTITLSGMVWFVNNNAGACSVGPCDGRMSHPLANTQTIGAANQVIFVYGSAANYSGTMTLANGQRLVGEDAIGTLAVRGNVTPQNGQTLPSTNGPTPTLAGTITLGQNNFVHGVTTALINGNTFGTLTINDNVSINTAGQALSLTNGTANVTFGSVNSSGGVNNVNLDTIAGTLVLGTGALSGASGNAFNVSTGTGTITYNGTIASGSARSVSVASMTGGTVTFNGAITDTDTGISLTNNTGATINFTNTITASTGANAAFAATGGGTVSAIASGSTLTTTAATALNVTGTTIGASGLTFRSISSSGGTATGIILDNTGPNAGLTVTGNGTVASGGTISSKSGANTTTSSPTDSSNIINGGTPIGVGIFLRNTRAISLTRMQLNDFSNYAILGENVVGLSIDNSTLNGTNGDTVNTTGNAPFEGTIHITNLTGTASFTNSTITDVVAATSSAITDTIHVMNTSGTLNMTIDNCTVSNVAQAGGPGGKDSVFFGTPTGTSGSPTMNLTINNSNFTATRQFHLQVNVQGGTTSTINVTNSHFSNSNMVTFGTNGIVSAGGGINLTGGGNVAGGVYVKYLVQNNTFQHSTGSNPGATNGGAMLITGIASQLGTFDGKILNNTFGVSGVARSSAGNAADALRLFASGNNGSHGNTKVLVQNNVIKGWGEAGIQFNARQGNAQMDITVLGNTIDEPGPAAQGAFAAIWVNVGALAADTNQMNIAIGGTSPADKNVMQNSDPNNFSDVFLDRASCGGCASVLNLYRNGSVAAGAGEPLIRQIVVDDNTPTLDLQTGFTNGSIGTPAGLPPQPS